MNHWWHFLSIFSFFISSLFFLNFSIFFEKRFYFSIFLFHPKTFLFSQFFQFSFFSIVLFSNFLIFYFFYFDSRQHNDAKRKKLLMKRFALLSSCLNPIFHFVYTIFYSVNIKDKVNNTKLFLSPLNSSNKLWICFLKRRQVFAQFLIIIALTVIKLEKRKSF